MVPICSNLIIDDINSDDLNSNFQIIPIITSKQESDIYPVLIQNNSSSFITITADMPIALLSQNEESNTEIQLEHTSSDFSNQNFTPCNFQNNFIGIEPCSQHNSSHKHNKV